MSKLAFMEYAEQGHKDRVRKRNARLRYRKIRKNPKGEIDMKGKRTYIAIALGVAVVAVGVVQSYFKIEIIPAKNIQDIRDALMLAVLWFIRSGIGVNGGGK